MPPYVYAWTISPLPNLEIELRICAATAGDARRELQRFLAAQPPGDWRVRGVARSPAPPTSQGALRAAMLVVIAAPEASSSQSL